MSYNFSTLSPAAFEDLVRDLIGRELGITFEGFDIGPDGGMDSRHAADRGVSFLRRTQVDGVDALAERISRAKQTTV